MSMFIGIVIIALAIIVGTRYLPPERYRRKALRRLLPEMKKGGYVRYCLEEPPTAIQEIWGAGIGLYSIVFWHPTKPLRRVDGIQKGPNTGIEEIRTTDCTGLMDKPLEPEWKPIPSGWRILLI